MKRTKRLAILLVGCFLIVLPLGVMASGKAANQSVYIGADEIIDGNFIKAGNVIEINGAVNGDVIVAGNMITVAGPVAGDVIVAGNMVKITGKVGGSVRVVGSTIEVNSDVERNVWVAGANISLGKNSKVGWDVFAGGASIIIGGPVSGNIFAGGASIVIDNEVSKNITASLDKDGQLILNPKAKVTGNLTYHALSSDQLILNEGATVDGEITQKPFAQGPELKASRIFSAAYMFFKIIALFGLLVVGLIAISLVPKKVLEVKEEMLKRPWPSIGWGVVYFFLTPIAVVLLMLTIIGVPLALIIIPLYFISLYFAVILAGFTIGLLISDKLSAKKDKYKGSLIWPLILGLAVVLIVTSIPIFGWLVKLVIIWWALGAIIQVKKETLKEYR